MTTTHLMAPATVVSSDGTPIAVWSAGDGPPLLLVHGMTSNHATFDPTLRYLTPHITVHALDRRGRGRSGDADAYDLEREFEDIAAVIDHIADTTGRRVDLLGHSFGGLCAFGAVRRTANVRRLILYEGWPVPDPTAILGADGVMGRVDELLATGDDEAALATFYRDVVGMSEAFLDAFRASPKWPDRVAAAPTIPREVAAQNTGMLDPSEAAEVDVPVLLLIGRDSPDHLSAGVNELAAALPDARIAELEGQQHLAYLEAPALFAETVLSYLRSDQRPESAWRRSTVATPYTLGQWTAIPGREDDLVAAWHDLAEWTENHVAGSGWAKLLQDREDPRRFVSFGPWQDDDAIAAWREHDGFRTRVDRLRELVESFTPHSMEVADQVGPPTPDP